MVLAPHFQRCILRQHVAGLGELPLAAEYDAGHDQGLSLGPALRQTANYQQLVRAELGYARTSSMQALLIRSAFSTVSTMCGAFRPASSYCLFGLSCSWKRSGKRMVRILRPASMSPSSLAKLSTCAPRPPVEASSIVTATSCAISRRRIRSVSSGFAKRRSAPVVDSLFASSSSAAFSASSSRVPSD